MNMAMLRAILGMSTAGQDQGVVRLRLPVGRASYM